MVEQGRRMCVLDVLVRCRAGGSSNSFLMRNIGVQVLPRRDRVTGQGVAPRGLVNLQQAWPYSPAEGRLPQSGFEWSTLPAL